MFSPLSRRSGIWFEPPYQISLTGSALVSVSAYSELNQTSLIGSASVSVSAQGKPDIYFKGNAAVNLSGSSVLTIIGLSKTTAINLTAQGSLLLRDPNNPLRGFHVIFPACRVYATHEAIYESVPNYYLHTTSYGITSQSLHTAIYESPSIFCINETAWSTTAQLIHSLTYQSQASQSAFTLHDANYQSSGGLSAVFTLHESAYVSLSGSTAIFTLHEATYGQADHLIVNALHDASYRSTGSLLSSVFYRHEASYASTGGATQAFTIHESTYGEANRVFVYSIHDASYTSSGGTQSVFAIHESGYVSSGGLQSAFIAHESRYDSFRIFQIVFANHESGYASSGSALSVFVAHDSRYASSGSLSSEFIIHDAAWQSVAIDQTALIHEQTYQSVATSATSHTVAYWSENFNPIFAVHDTRYRSYNTDTQFVLANAYILPDIQLSSAQVTADEDSPYYQCEVELRDSIDYRKFVRDQEFTLRIFDEDYVFVVDSKNLSRSIDESGNLQETVTLSGLSPLCLKASPRAKTITKTWDTPTFAKAIVEELLGTVTWNLVNWMIPAYRLSADNADPLTIAQQVVNAAGGLIESQPNGRIVVRHRWPVSITDLSTNVAEIFDETMIYSLRESPTQDVLMDRIRIMDSNAGYQDRLEYVPNELSNGDDDSWTGILYGYPSPWRDGLSFATTRGSKIQLGIQSEGTRLIDDDNPDVDIAAETLTFTDGQSSTQYPIMQIHSVEWMDENLGSLTYAPYSTTVEVSQPGHYYGHSLAKVSYTTRFLQIPVHCTPSITPIEAQFLLLEQENTNG